MESAFPSAQWLPPDFSPELKSEVGRIQFPDGMAYECAALFQSCLPALILSTRLLVSMIISILFTYTCVDGVVTAFLLK